MVFLRNYKDQQVRESQSLSDSGFCTVMLRTVEFLESTENTPDDLVEIFTKELCKKYQVQTLEQLKEILRQRSQAQQAADNEDSG